MNSQLQELVDELRSASERLRRLAERLPAERWAERTDSERWSVAECVEHLNLTGRAYLPPLRAALQEARELGGAAPLRYRRDPVGWLLWRTMGPPVRVRLPTPAAFVPGADREREELLREFERLQEEQVALVREGDGLPLQRVRMRSPFDARVRYNLFSGLSILPRHQHRHLWQAERVHAV